MFRVARAVASAINARTVAAAVASAAVCVGVSTHTHEEVHAARAARATPEAQYVYKGTAKKENGDIKALHRVELPKPKVIFVLGGPGAGKGTQCTRLVNEYGFVHLSAGDLLREERDSGSPDGELITQYINEGKIVPVEVTVNLIKKAMLKSGAAKFLVDGFPRNFDNLQGWQRVMGDAAEVEGVLFYDCAESVMEKRLLERGKTSGRSDDQADVIRKRFKTYIESTMPVIKYYEDRGRVFRVDADQPVGKVFEDTKRVLEPTLKAELTELTQLLLDAVHASDWETYAALTDPAMTAVEPESNYAPVVGLDFHKYYFTLASKRHQEPGYVPSKSTTTNVHVRMLNGKAAVVTYTRVVQKGAATEHFGETRVWQLTAHGWKNVHFHRSPKITAPVSVEEESE